MMEIYDAIVLTDPLDEAKIPSGTRGVILMVFESPSIAYEVELVDEHNRSLGTYTLREDQIELRKEAADGSTGSNART